MAVLNNLQAAIDRLKINEDRLDQFINQPLGYTNSEGKYVNSLEQVAALALEAATILNPIIENGSINNSSINTTPIGDTTPSTGAFTTVNASGTITGNSFSGSGSGLTGLAPNLSIGGNAATANTAISATTANLADTANLANMANTATNLNGGTVNATTGSFSGNVTLGDTSADSLTVNANATFLNGVLVPLRPFGDISQNAASTQFVRDNLIFALPDQEGNAGRVLTTDGTTTSWELGVSNAKLLFFGSF